jgi:hypothetical protein
VIRSSAAALLLFALQSAALAAETEDEPGAPRAASEVESEDEEASDDRIASLEATVEGLESYIQEIEAKEKQEKSRLTFNGYVDFGFFIPEGTGSGVVQDLGNVNAPDLAGQFAWVFLGDLLSSPVNSRGEAAELGDLPGVSRFDSVDSKGAAGFILNEVNVGLTFALSDSAAVMTSLDFVPRSGSEFALGDFFELDLAQLEWRVLDDPSLTIFLGKIEPSIGIEYRERKPVRRFGVTPSLIARYTTGTQLGAKVRAKLFEERLIVAAAVTNGSAVTEQFHFYDEIDSNDGKTLSGRVAVRFPLGGLSEAFAGALEIGLSGQWGPQDRATDNEGALWFVGLDLSYDGVDLDVRAQLLTGGSPGRETDRAYALDLKLGGYLEIDWMLLPELGVLVRGDFRDALVSLADERAYLSKSLRFTAGLRLVVSSHVVVKLEYLKNLELEEVPSIDNDVFTSSLVLSY